MKRQSSETTIYFKKYYLLVISYLPAARGFAPGRGSSCRGVRRRCSRRTKRRRRRNSVSPPWGSQGLDNTASLPPASYACFGRVPPLAPNRNHRSSEHSCYSLVSCQVLYHGVICEQNAGISTLEQKKTYCTHQYWNNLTTLQK